MPAHSVITKRDLILRGSCFCEKYSAVYSDLLDTVVYDNIILLRIYYNQKT